MKVIAFLALFTGVLLIFMLVGWWAWGLEGLAEKLVIVYGLTAVVAGIFTYFCKTDLKSP